jgi:hypothetical protein
VPHEIGGEQLVEDGDVALREYLFVVLSYDLLEIFARHPHPCGWVFVGYVDEYGEEWEASYRCRRCADSR